MAQSARIDGLAELLRTMRELPREIVSKNGGPVRSALFKAAKLIRDAAIDRAPLRTGALRRAIYVYRDRSPDGSGVAEQYFIGVRKVRLTRAERKKLSALLGGLRASGIKARVADVKGDPYYWRFIEFGTSEAAAKPFLRPALEYNRDRALSVFKAEFARGVERAVKKARGAR